MCRAAWPFMDLRVTPVCEYGLMADNASNTLCVLSDARRLQGIPR